MDELYTFCTLGGLKFYYRISSETDGKVTIITFAYGTHKPPPRQDEVTQFSEELKTFSTAEAAARYVAELQSYVKHLGYTLCPNTANSALSN